MKLIIVVFAALACVNGLPWSFIDGLKGQLQAGIDKHDKAMENLGWGKEKKDVSVVVEDSIGEILDKDLINELPQTLADKVEAMKKSVQEDLEVINNKESGQKEFSEDLINELTKLEDKISEGLEKNHELSDDLKQKLEDKIREGLEKKDDLTQKLEDKISQGSEKLDEVVKELKDKLEEEKIKEILQELESVVKNKEDIKSFVEAIKAFFNVESWKREIEEGWRKHDDAMNQVQARIRQGWESHDKALSQSLGGLSQRWANEKQTVKGLGDKAEEAMKGVQPISNKLPESKFADVLSKHVNILKGVNKDNLLETLKDGLEAHFPGL